MDIIQRNLFRLIRSGAFQTSEELEPMSVSKWNRLYKVAILYDVTGFVYQGITRCQDQFFFHQTKAQQDEWQQAWRIWQTHDGKEDEEEGELIRPDKLTNPILNRKLQAILDDEQSDITTRQLLLALIRIVRQLLNKCIPVRQLTEMAILLHTHHKDIDFNAFNQWIHKLQLNKMAQICGGLFVQLFHFDEQELPFYDNRQTSGAERVAKELTDFTKNLSQDWYFTQEDGEIFVHNTDSSATFSHVRRSARYFRYYPAESITNFFASFAHSLSHIEE